MFHRIAIWRVFVPLDFSTFSTKSAVSGHSGGGEASRRVRPQSGRSTASTLYAPKRRLQCSENTRSDPSPLGQPSTALGPGSPWIDPDHRSTAANYNKFGTTVATAYPTKRGPVNEASCEVQSGIAPHGPAFPHRLRVTKQVR